MTLQLLWEGRQLKDVMFETHGGASNTTGRCLRQVLWEYPWRADVPQTVELSAPKAPPSGWAVLEHVRLLSSTGGQPSGRGVLDAIPLVHACLRNGTGLRPGVVFYVQTQPVRVFPLIAGPGQSYAASFVANDSERCVQAVLASTLYPSVRPYKFDFARGAAPGEPAALDDVAHYFEPKGLPDAPGAMDMSMAKAALQGLNPKISVCWESALDRRAGIAGSRTLRIRVQSSGAVAFAQVVSDRALSGDAEAIDYLLDRCLAQVVTAAKIPPPEGGAAELAYTWNFALRQ